MKEKTPKMAPTFMPPKELKNKKVSPSRVTA